MQRDKGSMYLTYGSNMYKKLKSKRPLTITTPSTKTTLLFVFVLLIAAFCSLRSWLSNSSDAFMISSSAISTSITTPTQNLSNLHQTPQHREQPPPPPPPPPALIPFTCPSENHTATCHPPFSSLFPQPANLPTSIQCPDYFRWIHEDLSPWKNTGITEEMVERARRTANFRLVVLSGRVYIERYQRAFQTRDVFTIWGILQLLRRYPGQIPDFELMFDCVDWPVVKAVYYHGRDKPDPPPLFRYCGDDSTLDIVFPDWSFWGWAEINIKPWDALLREFKERNKEIKWMDREPYAYWKGNPAVALTRQDLLKCNVSNEHDWNARVYAQDWRSEIQKGFKQSDLTSQCIHRYKIYIEGTAWSVSQKYILACDSPALIVSPHYYDFFSRELMPVHHYWPIREDDKCKSIKFAVDWGNSHKRKAQDIGKEASNFMQESLKMDYVYDYMFHLLNEYAKLLKYKPTKPARAVEVCAESMACPAKGLAKKFMMESMVKIPASSLPCTLPPPFNPVELRLFQRRKANSIKNVEMWEQKTWERSATGTSKAF